jgi:hypothetical protein
MVNIWSETSLVSGIALAFRILTVIVSALAVAYTWRETVLKKIDNDSKFALLSRIASPRQISTDQEAAFSRLLQNYSLSGLVAVRTVSPDPECVQYCRQIAKLFLDNNISIETQPADSRPTAETGIVIYTQAMNEPIAKKLAEILGSSDVRIGDYGKYAMIIAIAGKPPTQ